MRNIPSSIQDKINKQNQTIYENANPKMNVAIARAKTTVMDSTYWAVETIREKAGLGDVSLAPRRFKTRGTPNRIYEIHVDNGIVKTSIREYPDKLKDGWQDQFTLGSGSKVAIAFNGHWERYRKLWRLVTDEKPHILWVDGDNKLQTQLWDNVESKQELDTDVVYVRALRGWKNVNFIDKDQGIIAGYIKSDGTVWYRNYCDIEDNNPAWENERQLEEFTGTAISLNLFITNDYRMGFIIEDSLGKVYWYITERNWAGMAISPENIKANINGTNIDFFGIEQIISINKEYITANLNNTKYNFCYNLADNNFRMIENFSITMTNEYLEDYEDWGYRLRITSEHGFSAITLADFTLKDSLNIPFVISEIKQVGGFFSTNKIYNIKVSDFNNAVGDMTLSFNGAGTTKGEAGQTINNTILSFTPINLVPVLAPVPEVEVIWNE